jgi:hypothetical protein
LHSRLTFPLPQAEGEGKAIPPPATRHASIGPARRGSCLADLAAAQRIAAQQGATLIELRANSDLKLHSKAS